MKPRQVRSLNDLKKLTRNKPCEFRMSLNGGFFSTKTIEWNPDLGEFSILNHIDDSEQDLSEKRIMQKKYTLIGFAITKRALWYMGEA